MKNRHYEKLAQREKAPILFDTGSPLCQSFSNGLRQCAYQQRLWPEVAYETQNQHCTALLNIVAERLNALEIEEKTVDTGDVNITVSHENSTKSNWDWDLDNGVIAIKTPVTNWTDFGLGYGCGMSGYLVLIAFQWLVAKLYFFITKRFNRMIHRVQNPVPFAFVRGAPTRLPEGIPARATPPPTQSGRDSQTVPASV